MAGGQQRIFFLLLVGHHVDVQHLGVWIILEYKNLHTKKMICASRYLFIFDLVTE